MDLITSICKIIVIGSGFGCYLHVFVTCDGGWSYTEDGEVFNNVHPRLGGLHTTMSYTNQWQWWQPLVDRVLSAYCLSDVETYEELDAMLTGISAVLSKVIGPSMWKNQFPICGHQSQSPINLRPSEATLHIIPVDDGLEVSGYDKLRGNCIMRNDGRQVEVKMAGGLWLIRGGILEHTYALDAVYFHWGVNGMVGSEHTIDGKTFPLEMQFVHHIVRNNTIPVDAIPTVIIGVLFEEVETDNRAYRTIIDALPSVKYKGDNVPMKSFRLRDWFPFNLNEYYTYEGSLTTPPCTENVVWIVAKERERLSHKQMDAFRQLKTLGENKDGVDDTSMVNNFRPVQPVGGRSVVSVGLVTPSEPPESASPHEAPGVISNVIALIMCLLFI